MHTLNDQMLLWDEELIDVDSMYQRSEVCDVVNKKLEMESPCLTLSESRDIIHLLDRGQVSPLPDLIQLLLIHTASLIITNQVRCLYQDHYQLQVSSTRARCCGDPTDPAVSRYLIRTSTDSAPCPPSPRWRCPTWRTLW